MIKQVTKILKGVAVFLLLISTAPCLHAYLEQQISPEVTGDGLMGDEFGVTMSHYGDTLLVASPGAFEYGYPSPASGAYVYRRGPDGWVEEAKLMDAPESDMDASGFDVCLYDENTAFIGVIKNVSNMPYMEVIVYTFDGDSWTLSQRFSPYSQGMESGFGLAIESNSNSVFISALAATDGVGVVHVYSKDSSGDWVEEQILSPSDGVAGDWFGRTITASENTIMVATDNSEPDGSSCVYVYHLDNGLWVEAQKLTAPDVGGWNSFGFRMALDGDDRAIINGSGLGYAYIYQRAGGVWSTSQKLTLSNGEESNEAFSVGLSGDTAVSAEATQADGCYVRFYSELNGVWTETESIQLSDSFEPHYIGYSLEFDGTDLFVGSRRIATLGVDDGIAHHLAKPADTWEVQQTLSVERSGDSATYRQFGQTVAISGDKAVVGVPNEMIDGNEKTGAVYVYERMNNTWQLQARLTAPDWAAFDEFGRALAVDGTTIAVGAPGDDVASGSGSIYLFTEELGVWSFASKLNASGTESYGNFGNEIELQGDTLIASGGGYETEAVYVFSHEGGVWTEKAKLVASGSEPSFGRSISLSQERILVSADEAAYIFEYDGVSWNEMQRIQSASPGFGEPVSLGNDMALIGVMYHLDPEIHGVGAVYVYELVGEVWEESQILLASDRKNRDQFGRKISLSNDLALIGSLDRDYWEYSNYLFELKEDGSWEEREKITRSDARTLGESSFDISGRYALIGDRYFSGMNTDGEGVTHQGAVFAYYFPEIGLDSDGDMASDSWEVAHGYDPALSTDYSTLDSDGDGQLDLAEIYMGTDKDSAGPFAGPEVFLQDNSGTSVSIRYRRSTTDQSVRGLYKWSNDLTNWQISGGQANGLSVGINEEIVETGADYEVVEATAEVELGSTDKLFISLDLIPVD